MGRLTINSSKGNSLMHTVNLHDTDTPTFNTLVYHFQSYSAMVARLEVNKDLIPRELMAVFLDQRLKSQPQSSQKRKERGSGSPLCKSRFVERIKSHG